MLLLALAIAPGVGISLYIFFKDKYNQEPKLKLFVCFLLGCLSCVPAVILSLTGRAIVEGLITKSILSTAIMAFVVVGLSEEFSKSLMVRYYAYPKKTFDEPFDGIVYCVMVSMGFATLENVLYVMQNGLGNAIARMFTSVPAHATFGVIMGYYMGKAKFEPARSKELIQKGLFSAAFVHGLYDFFLFLGSEGLVTQDVYQVLLFLGAIASLIVALILSRKAIRLHLEHSKALFQQ